MRFGGHSWSNQTVFLKYQRIQGAKAKLFYLELFNLGNLEIVLTVFVDDGGCSAGTDPLGRLKCARLWPILRFFAATTFHGFVWINNLACSLLAGIKYISRWQISKQQQKSSKVRRIITFQTSPFNQRCLPRTCDFFEGKFEVSNFISILQKSRKVGNLMHKI